VGEPAVPAEEGGTAPVVPAAPPDLDAGTPGLRSPRGISTLEADHPGPGPVGGHRLDDREDLSIREGGVVAVVAPGDDQRDRSRGIPVERPAEGEGRLPDSPLASQGESGIAPLRRDRASLDEGRSALRERRGVAAGEEEHQDEEAGGEQG